MHSLRIRAVRLDFRYGAGTSLTYAVQISQDGLLWWTLNRFEDEASALDAAFALAAFCKANQLVKASAILWKANL